MATNIVSTNTPYNSYVLKQNLTSLKNSFPFIDVQSVGNSVMGDSLYCVRIGTGSKEVFYSGAIHRKRMDYCPFTDEIY